MYELHVIFLLTKFVYKPWFIIGENYSIGQNLMQLVIAEHHSGNRTNNKSVMNYAALTSGRGLLVMRPCCGEGPREFPATSRLCCL